MLHMKRCCWWRLIELLRSPRRQLRTSGVEAVPSTPGMTLLTPLVGSGGESEARGGGARGKKQDERSKGKE